MSAWRKSSCFVLFLSTPSARRATGVYICEACGTDISIHALREEGDICCVAKVDFAFFISIHALREEGDQNRCSRQPARSYFYPRPPRGGRLFEVVPQNSVRTISIHALREEGDVLFCLPPGLLRNFYPRPPRGGRLQSHVLQSSL